jgi:hypothetical protein
VKKALAALAVLMLLGACGESAGTIQVASTKPTTATTARALPTTTTSTTQATTTTVAAPTTTTTALPRPVRVHASQAAPATPAGARGPNWTDNRNPPPRGRYAGYVNGARCGADLPPCRTLWTESKGDLDAYNPSGCYEKATGHRGCTGKWQCSYSTCSGRGTEDQQDAEVRPIWAGGRGCSNWNAC